MAMGLFRLFFGFDGRIGRLAYWFGLLVLILVSPFSISAILSSDPFQEAFHAVRNLGLAGLGWALGLLVPLAALNTKRLHDINKSGLIGVLFYAPALLSAVTLFTDWQLEAVNQMLSWTYAVAALFGVASAWFLFKLGFQAGTRGANKYGPSPSDR